MPIFRYKAASPDGKVLEGEMEAIDRQAVIRQLQADGHILIRAEENDRLATFRDELTSLLKRREFSARELGEFTLELATFLEAGVPLDKALSMLVQLSDKAKKREILSRLHADVHGGAYLSRAMEAQGRVFSAFYRNMIKAGEASGTLYLALERLAIFLQRSRELREAVVSALIYPLILVLVSCISLTIILGFVVPRISEMFDQAGQALPWFTQLVMAAGSVVQHYGWVLALAAAVGFILGRRQLRDPATRLRVDGWLLKVPLIGDLIAKTETARFTRTLETLVGGGVPLLNAIGIAKEVVMNQVIATGIASVFERVRQGEGLARPLQESGVFPGLVGRLLQVGEETGNLEKMLLRLAEIHEREVQLTVRRLMAVVEPVLIIGLSVLIAGIIMSIVVPLFSINDLAF